MKNDDKFKHHFCGSGYSDDCAGMSGMHLPDGEDADEYQGCHNWFELKINGEVVGECIMNYDGGWEFRSRSNTHKIEAGKILSAWSGEVYGPEDFKE